jgi:hypothetical protein
MVLLLLYFFSLKEEKKGKFLHRPTGVARARVFKRPPSLFSS